MTWNEVDRAAREIAAGLRSLGLGLGDRVGLLANTRWEWIAADVGILLAGGVTVPIYQSNLPDQVDYILEDSGAKLCLVEDAAQHAKVSKARTIVMGGKVDGVTSLAELRAAGVAWLAANPGALEKT